MWAYESVFYQIYPIGFCDAPRENDGVLTHRITHVNDFVDHIASLGVGAVLFNPIFESDSHGYNTRDYTKIDVRLGTNEDFAEVCKNLHAAGIKVVLDGVFNHVGRGFFAFEDVKKNKWDSKYKDWFYINFDGNSGYNDGFWYEGWEGHYDLVKLNLGNEEVIQHLFSAIKGWIDEFDIDGLRLDVAYQLSTEFTHRLRDYCDSLKEDFFLVGEMIHGDYGKYLGEGGLHSITNYECYKGLYSSFNSMNMFEICHSLKRQYGPEEWTLYKGQHLLSFVDNHDVSRIASTLTNENHLKPIYALCMGMPGIPCIYYGSEWGALGDKSQGDDALRPYFDKPVENDLTEFISKLSKAHTSSKAICYGDLSVPVLTNGACVIERRFEDERALIAINAMDSDFNAGLDAHGDGKELITGTSIHLDGNISLKPYECKYIIL